MYDVMIRGVDHERERFVQHALYAALDSVQVFMPYQTESQILNSLLNSFYHYLMQAIERHIHDHYEAFSWENETIMDAIDHYAEGLGLSLTPDALKLIEALTFHNIAFPGLPLVRSKGGFSCA